MAFDCWTDLITRGMAARAILGERVYAAYERQPPPTRKQWLLGRIAAKDAVRFRLWDDGHTTVFPIELTVTNEPNGRPGVTTFPPRNYPECDVSLAHTAEIAVAIAGPRRSAPDAPGVGIDVAEITPRPDAALAIALSAPEQQMLDGLARTGGRTLWFTRFWAAKEAVAKAEGTGFGGVPTRFRVVAATENRLTVRVGERTYLVDHREVANPHDLAPRGYVVAWTWGPASPGSSPG